MRFAFHQKGGKKMYCTELDKYCNEITNEECDGCCDTCIFCDTYYDAE